MKVFCEVQNSEQDGKIRFLEDTHKILVLRVQGGGDQTDKAIIKKSEPFEPSDGVVRSLHFQGCTWNYDPGTEQIYISNCPIEI